MNRYVLQIDGERRDCEFFIDALHDAYTAVEQGAKRVLMIRVADGAPLVVLSPPEGT